MEGGSYESRAVESSAADGVEVRISSTFRGMGVSNLFCDRTGESAEDVLSGWSNDTAYPRDAVEVNIMWPSSESRIIAGADRSAGVPSGLASFMTKSRSWKATDPSHIVLSLNARPAVSDTEEVISKSRRETHSLSDMKLTC